MRAAFVLAAVLLSGCVAPVQATRNLPQPQSLDQVNLLLRGKRVTIELADGEQIRNVRDAVVSPHDVRFQSRAELRAVAVGDVARITYVRNRGARVGSLAGMAPGVLLALGSAAALRSDGNLTAQFAGLYGLMLSVPYTLAGAAFGGWVGQGVSPGGVVPVYEGPVERYRVLPAQRSERP